MNFKRIDCTETVFFKEESKSQLTAVVLIYVDDIIFMSTSETILDTTVSMF